MLKWVDLPPVWLVAAMAAMWGLAEYAPVWRETAEWSRWLGRALIAAALGVMAWTTIHFRRARTTIIPHLEPDALVTTGPMRFSRNPIYAADALVLIGWAVSLGAVSPLIVIPAFVRIIQSRFIVGEEVRLAAAFGPEFAAYKAKVRRWI